MSDKKITDLPILAAPDMAPTTDVFPVVNGGITKQVSVASAVLATITSQSLGVASVNTRTGAVTLASTDVGLANVNNTSDANKPVSTAQQAALDLKANLASPTFTGTVGGITKTMVGLANVDNTSDVNKPVSTAQATAISAVSPGRLIGIQAFLASGTYTPTAGTNSVVVEVQAPGGGSGGVPSFTTTGGPAQWAGGNGGGGGGWGRKRITSGFSGAAITIGTPGAGGAAGNNAGTAGGTASFGALLSCTGGGGGAGCAAVVANATTNPTAPAAGGVATGADVSRPGRYGGTAIEYAAFFSIVGSGGDSQYAPSPGPLSTYTTTTILPAVAGTGYGGGASGPINGSSSTIAAQAGAAGGPGIVIVWEYA